jgi:ABC-type multidrug transport system fused ATPase/permease subunit
MAQLPNIIERQRSLWEVVIFVIKHSLRGSKKYSIIRYITAAINASLLFLQFGSISIFVNEFITYGVDHARPIILFKGFLLFLVSEILPEIIGQIHGYVWNVQNDDFSRYLQSLFFDKMQELDIGTIEQPELQNMVEISQTRGWSAFYSINQVITDSVRQIIAFIISIVALIAISPWVALIIFIGTLPTYFTERKSAQMSADVSKENSEQWRVWKVKSQVIFEKDSLTELKNNNVVNIFKGKFLDAISLFHEKMRIMRKSRLKNGFLTELLILISFASAFYLLIRDVRTGAIAVGSLVFCFSVVSRFQTSINQLLNNFGKMSEYKKNMDIFIDYLETKAYVISGARSIHPDDFESLEFRQVSFHYPNTEHCAIKNISFSIRQPGNIAIVGLNGAGKTTLLKLITRVYDPTEGEILLNGINLKEYRLDDWKKCLGILLQEYSLYAEETIIENVMLGHAGNQDREFAKMVCQETTAHEFIHQLPDRYDQRVGTEFRGGVELSKGQKQKLALARVLYRNAPIIILDEPTAAIDALSEDIIFKSLREKHTHQTRIIISHKFSNVRDADRIILIEQGVIIEQGSHHELMEIPEGRYRELFELQAEGYK